MPYANDQHAVYRLVNTRTQQCYIGSSRRVRKRVAEHFRLLRHGIHPNPKLQKSFEEYGEEAFSWDVEVVCEDPDELGVIEECFLSEEASFQTPVFFNISHTAKEPMKGRKHSEETKARISESKKKNMSYVKNDAYRQKISELSRERMLSDERFVERIRFIVDNPHLSYAERGRRLGTDTSSVRKLALRYADLKGTL